jgi:hypothetical protein
MQQRSRALLAHRPLAAGLLGLHQAAYLFIRGKHGWMNRKNPVLAMRGEIRGHYGTCYT